MLSMEWKMTHYLTAVIVVLKMSIRVLISKTKVFYGFDDEYYFKGNCTVLFNCNDCLIFLTFEYYKVFMGFCSFFKIIFRLIVIKLFLTKITPHKYILGCTIYWFGFFVLMAYQPL